MSVDEFLYVYPIIRWPETEGSWRVYVVQGGWKIRDLGSDMELVEDKHHGRI